MRKRHILSRILSLLLVVCFITPNLLIDWAGAARLVDGFLAPIDDPDANAVQISTPEQLDNIRNDLNGSYVLVNDIDLSNYDWTPIGKTLTEPFRGKLDGQGFTISGLQVESDFTAATLLPPSYAVGLFGVCDGAQIKNIKLQNVAVSITSNSGYLYDLTNIDSGNLYAGAFAGYAIGNTVLYNSFVSDGMVSAVATDEAQSSPHAGGLIGFAQHSIVSFCHNNSSVSASYKSGLFGYDTYAGGLIAFTSGDGAVDRSFNCGSVETDMGDYGIGYAGGLIGVSEADGIAITDCFNESSVSVRTGSSGLFGGEDAYVGGIAASFCGEIGRAYNSGSISAQNNDPYGLGSGNLFLGGICAQAESSAEIQSVVVLSANVTAAGGSSSGTHVYSIANGGNQNQTAVIEGFPQGAVDNAEMKISSSDALSQAFYEEQMAWDFSAIWEFVADKSYPQLKTTDLDSEEYENEFLTQHLQFISGSTYNDFLDSQRWAQIYWSEENNFYSNSAGALYEVINGIITGDYLKFSKLLAEDSLYQIILADYITDQSVKSEIEKSFEKKLPQTIDKAYDSVKNFISENWEDAWGQLSDEDIFYLLHYDELPAEEWINSDFEKHLDEIVYNDRHGLAEALEISVDNLDKVLNAKDKVEQTVLWFHEFVEYSASVNAYLSADEDFQLILKKMLDHIPDGDLVNSFLLQEAIKDYTEFEDDAGIEQLFQNFAVGEIGFKKLSELIDSKISNWLNAILPEGAKGELNYIKWAANITWKIGELVTKNGKLNDCRQMLHSNAFFEETLYETLQEIQNDFIANPTLENAELFDAAFKFFKEVQLYSMDICISYFDTYQTAWLPAIRHQSNTFLNSAIEEVQYNKLAISNTYCHGVSYFVGGKIITIACPTDVYLFDENGNSAVEIVDSEVTECATDISACAIDGVKIIGVPLDQSYHIQIKGTGTGYMDYSIAEYDAAKHLIQATVFSDISLSQNIIYTGAVENGVSSDEKDYALSNADSSTPIYPSQVVQPDSAIPVQGVVVQAGTTNLFVGDSVQLESEITPDDATVKSLVWYSSDPSVVQVSEEGEITAIGVGNAIVTAQSICGGEPGQIAISVQADPDDQQPEIPSDGDEDSGNTSPEEPDDDTSTGEDPAESGGSGGGGSSSSSSSISVIQSNHGTISVSPSRAQTGDTVTITIVPDEGYILDQLIVTDHDSDPVTIERVSDTEYVFIKPDGVVKVKAIFIEDTDKEPVFTPTSLPFGDVATNAWYANAVQYVYENGLMNGVSDASFNPNGTMSRAMLVTVLWRQAGEPRGEYMMPFADVAVGTWYVEAVSWAVSEGIVIGISETVFAPDSSITREQFAAVLYRYAQSEGLDVSDAWSSRLDFEDAALVGDYAYEALCWMTRQGVIEGSNDKLNPQGQTTRAEAATMLMRFCENCA